MYVNEMMASTLTAYIMWFFFGWAGLHHVYLGRLNQAIVWFATLGGGCGIGWLRDIWKIPEYVEWCNGDKSVQMKHLRRALLSPRPGCSWFRFAGMVVMGFVTSTVLGTIVPDFHGLSKTDPLTYNFLKYTFVALLILGNAIGVYLVANIGELQCAKYYPFMASLCIIPWLLGKNPNLLLASFFTAVITWYKGLRWRPLVMESEETLRSKKHLCKIMSIYMVACIVWLSVLSAGFYFNATITVENGEKIPVRDAINNFFKSDAWRRTKDSLYHFYIVFRHSGPWRAWSDTKGLFDFSGEVNAYKVLDLSPGASQSEISKQCRKLSATHHPDRFKSQSEKDRAQEKFIEIQHACSLMSSLHSRRSRASKMSTEDSDD